MAKFKLLVGRHTERGGKLYKAGDIIESDIDLVAFGGADKFRRVSSKTPASKPQIKAEEKPPLAKPEAEEFVEPEAVVESETEDPELDEQPEFDAMTVAELKKYAADNGFDVHGLTKKPDLISALRAALNDVASNN